MTEETEVAWATIDERRHQLRALREHPAGDGEHGEPISVADLRALIERRYDQLVVTLYLNLMPEEVVRRTRPYLEVFNSLRHQEEAARRELVEAQPRQARYALREDLDGIQEALGSLEPEGMRSVVAFKSGSQLNLVVTLPVRTAESLTIEATPQVEPLWAILDRNPRVLVVEARKEESRLWLHHLGRLWPAGSIESFVPADTVDRSRPGKEQRHRLTHLRWHLRATATAAARLFRERDADLLVLVGDEEVLAELDRFLPNELQGRVAGRLHPSPRAGREEWRQQIERVLADRRRAEEEAAVERLGDLSGRHPVARTLPGVVDALNRFQVRWLLLSAALSSPGFRCREHAFLSLAEGRCPFDGTELSPSANLADELVEVAALYGVDLTLVQERPELLDPYGGVAGLLYDVRD
jgi:hypothetical protein